MKLGLTGRRRHRVEKKWGRERLILQVEMVEPNHDTEEAFIAGRTRTIWRDATTADLTEEPAAA